MRQVLDANCARMLDPDTIAQAALDKLDSLKYRPAHPTDQHGSRRDWTCMAAVIAETSVSDGLGARRNNLECVAIGLGLKCLHEQAASPATVNDAHAEVMCRRSFRRYLLLQVRQVLCGEPSSIIEPVQPTPAKSPRQFSIRPGVRFHMYISQAPCGDASLEALAATTVIDKDQARDRTEHKRSTLLSSSQPESSMPMRGRNVFDLPCVLRTKPGRNDSIPTRSLSCSDKLARWQCLGLQGALLSVLIPDPLALSSIVVGDHFHLGGLERALVYRVYGHLLSFPLLLHTRVQFTWSQEFVKNNAGPNVNVVPAPHGFSWWSGGQVEYIVNGRKQGAAGKDGQYLRKTWSQVSKPVWFSAWSDVALSAGWTDLPRLYADAKRMATAYQERKHTLMSSHPVFSSWIGNDATQVDQFDVNVDCL